MDLLHGTGTHIYKVPEMEYAGTRLMQTSVGPSQNIFLPEMRDLISALVTYCSLDPYVGHYIQNITIAMQSRVVQDMKKKGQV